MGQNMIELRHNGFQISCWRTFWKRYDGVDVPKQNLELEPFVAQ